MHFSYFAYMGITRYYNINNTVNSPLVPIAGLLPNFTHIFEDMFRLALPILFAVEVVAHTARIIGRDASLNSSYDFIVVGGGTSGLTVADRLTENPESVFPLLDDYLRPKY
jgi:hypothetical protein